MSDRAWLIILSASVGAALVYFLAEGGKIGNWLVQNMSELTGLEALASLVLLVMFAGLLLGIAIVLLIRFPRQ